MHRLKVQGFLGIQQAEVTLDGLTVLIGAQASGKSVLARLIYFFNDYFADFNITVVSNNEHKMTYDKEKKYEFYEIFPQYSWEATTFCIEYSNDEHDVKITSDENSSIINMQTSLSVAKRFRSLKQAYKRVSEHESENDGSSRLSVRLAFREYMRNSSLNEYEPALFVPAARSFYATIRDEIFSILALDEKLDHIILKFGGFYEAIKNRVSRSPRYQRHLRSSWFSRIVKGRFERINGQDWIRMKHGSIELSRASSGQQEVIPLLFAILDFPRQRRTLIIEEPEAHLFPEAQIEVLDLMVRQLRTRGGNIMFTTHSPYLLSALNNHILANEKDASKGISLAKVQAYSIVDGVSNSLLDPELGLISAEYIDSVSEKISDRFSTLIGD